MDVGGWLRKLGLEQYEAAFRENRIDDTVLPSLTAEDFARVALLHYDEPPPPSPVGNSVVAMVR